MSVLELLVSIVPLVLHAHRADLLVCLVVIENVEDRINILAHARFSRGHLIHGFFVDVHVVSASAGREVQAPSLELKVDLAQGLLQLELSVDDVVCVSRVVVDPEIDELLLDIVNDFLAVRFELSLELLVVEL